MWHTIVLVAIYLSIAVAGVLLQRQATSGPGPVVRRPPAIPIYFTLIGAEWAILFFVWRPAANRGVTLRTLIGGRWKSARDVLVDVGLAVGFLVVVQAGGFLIRHWLGRGPKGFALPLPHGVLESLIWVGGSVSAGFCEEIIFRGYLQRQILALTRNPALAVIAQALVFGVGHAYQGWKAVVRIAFDGFVAGLLVIWRRSLRPGILAHVSVDIIGGLWFR